MWLPTEDFELYWPPSASVQGNTGRWVFASSPSARVRLVAVSPLSWLSTWLSLRLRAMSAKDDPSSAPIEGLQILLKLLPRREKKSRN